MYICKEHGVLDHEWCEKCNDTVKCDHSDQETWRFKDLSYDYKNGEITITIRVGYCETCGAPSWVRYDH